MPSEAIVEFWFVVLNVPNVMSGSTLRALHHLQRRRTRSRASAGSNVRRRIAVTRRTSCS